MLYHAANTLQEEQSIIAADGCRTTAQRRRESGGLPACDMVSSRLGDDVQYA